MCPCVFKDRIEVSYPLIPLLELFRWNAAIQCGEMSFDDLDSTVNPSLLSSIEGCLSLSFRTDYSNTKRPTGFRGFYTLQGEEEKGSIVSLSIVVFLLDYDDIFDCCCCVTSCDHSLVP